VKGPTWLQFVRAWRLGVGTVMLGWVLAVGASDSPSAVPYILAAGLGLMGLSFSIPWERNHRKNGES